MFDIVQWALGMDHSGPIKYEAPIEPTASRGLKMHYENGVEVEHRNFGRGFGVRFLVPKAVWTSAVNILNLPKKSWSLPI